MVYKASMKLSDYLIETKTDHGDFARTLGVSAKAVQHWLAGNRTPRPEWMVKIIAATDGAVTPIDFLPSVSDDAHKIVHAGKSAREKQVRAAQ